MCQGTENATPLGPRTRVLVLKGIAIARLQDIASLRDPLDQQYLQEPDVGSRTWHGLNMNHAGVCRTWMFSLALFNRTLVFRLCASSTEMILN